MGVDEALTPDRSRRATRGRLRESDEFKAGEGSVPQFATLPMPLAGHRPPSAGDATGLPSAWFSASLCALSELCGEELLDSGRRELPLEERRPAWGAARTRCRSNALFDGHPRAVSRAWRSAESTDAARRAGRYAARKPTPIKREWRPRQTRGSVPLTSWSCSRKRRASAQAPHRPSATPTRVILIPWLTNKRTRLWRSAPARRGADLVRPLRHEIREHAVDAGRTEEQRDAAEHREERRERLVPREREVVHFGHRPHGQNRQRGFEGGDGGAGRSSPERRIARRADEELRLARGRVRKRHVDRGQRAIASVQRQDVVRHADHGEPVTAFTGDFPEAVTDGAFVRPEAPGHRLVDDRDGRTGSASASVNERPSRTATLRAVKK